MLALFPLFFAFRSLPNYFAIAPWIAFYAATQVYRLDGVKRAGPAWVRWLTDRFDALAGLVMPRLQPVALLLPPEGEGRRGDEDRRPRPASAAGCPCTPCGESAPRSASERAAAGRSRAEAGCEEARQTGSTGRTTPPMQQEEQVEAVGDGERRLGAQRAGHQQAERRRRWPCRAARRSAQQSSEPLGRQP